MICRTHEALKYCNIQQGHEQTGTETETIAHTDRQVDKWADRQMQQGQELF